MDAQTQTPPAPPADVDEPRVPLGQLVAWFAVGCALGAAAWFGARAIGRALQPCEDCQEAPSPAPATLQAFRAHEAADGDTAPPDEPDVGRPASPVVTPGGPAGAAQVPIPNGVTFADVVPGADVLAPGSVIAERAPELAP